MMAASPLDAIKCSLRRRNRSSAAACVASLFGSVARGEDRAGSDIDLPVEMEDGRSLSLIRMEEARLLLEDAIGRPLDLGEIDCLRAAFERDRAPIF